MYIYIYIYMYIYIYIYRERDRERKRERERDIHILVFASGFWACRRPGGGRPDALQARGYCTNNNNYY